jgi:hypothetical protein
MPVELVRPCFISWVLDLQQRFLGLGGIPVPYQVSPAGPLHSFPFTLIS